MNKEEKIRTVIILEVIGRPAEYLTETLNDLIKKIGEEQGVKLIEAKMNEPCELKEQKDFYTSFAEIEFEADNLMVLTGIIFKYMPAHVEIIKPESLFSTNNDWNSIFNELVRRLHGYDEIARMVEVEKRILENKLREVLAEKQPIQLKENVTEKPKKKKKETETKKE
jgi:hypothetical protein